MLLVAFQTYLAAFVSLLELLGDGAGALVASCALVLPGSADPLLCVRDVRRGEIVCSHRSDPRSNQ